MPMIATLVAAALLAASALMSAADQAAALVTRQRARRLAESDRRGARALEALLDVPSRLHASSALVVALCVAWCAAAAAVYAAASAPTGAPAWAWAGAGCAIGLSVAFVFGVALPRTVAVQNPEKVAMASSRAARWVTRLAHPVARACAWPFAALMRLVGGPRAGVPAWATDDESRAAAPADEEETAREEAEEAFIEAVTEFATKVVREVMVPRTDMVCIADTASAAEAVAVLRDAGFSRLPVYHETLDDIVGVLYAKDLLLRIVEGGEVVPAAIARPPLFVPETKPVEELLVEMRRRAHIAIVADEHGGTAGLVTMEDLLEEIVGEIFDEYDEVETLVEDLGGGCYAIDARLPVDDLDDLLGTAFEAEADTVGGLVTEIAGRIPVRGDSIVSEGVAFVVEELDGARIIKLTVGPAAPSGVKEDG